MRNWKTTLSGIGVAFMSALAAIAALPYQLGDMSTIIPPAWKARVTAAAITAAFILRVINSMATADVKPAPSPAEADSP